MKQTCDNCLLLYACCTRIDGDHCPPERTCEDWQSRDEYFGKYAHCDRCMSEHPTDFHKFCPECRRNPDSARAQSGS